MTNTKKILSVILSIAMLTMFIPCFISNASTLANGTEVVFINGIAYSVGSNLVEDGSFEDSEGNFSMGTWQSPDGDGYFNKICDEYFYMVNRDTNEATVYTAGQTYLDFHADDYALGTRWNDGSQGLCSLANFIEVEAGKTYYIAFDYKHATATDCICDYIITSFTTTNESFYDGIKFETPNTVTTAWQTAKYIYTPEDNGYIFFHFRWLGDPNGNFGEGPYWYFDNFAVMEITDVLGYESDYTTTEFNTTRDVWNFSNSDTAFGSKSEGYEILLEDYNRLISNLSPTDRETITISEGLGYTRLNNTPSKSSGYDRFHIIQDGLLGWFRSINSNYEEWGGSCYGMSSWVCLAKDGILSVSDLDASASNLYDVDFSQKVESAINYYHNQQHLPAAIYSKSSFIRLSQNSQLQILEELAQNAGNGGSLVFIDFLWYANFNSDGTCDTSSGAAHAVVGYGLEAGSFECKEPSGAEDTYDRKVLIYDCSYPNGGDDYDLYFNTTNGKWCIPGWKIVSTNSQTMDTIYNNGAFKQITTDTSVINSVDYNTGEVSSSLSTSQIYTKFSAPSSSKYTILWDDYYCTVDGITVTENTSDEDIYVIMSANIDTDGNSHESTASIILPSGDYSYTVISDDSLAFSINYGDHLETVTSASGGTVTFNTDGETSVSLDNAADCTISLTSNDLTTAYDTFVVTSAEASEVTATLADSGMLVTSDNADDVSVFGLNASDSTGIAIVEGSENMLITETEDGTLSAWSDEDNSGEYTTPIESEIILTTWSITGYSNGTVTLTAPSDAEGDYYVTIAQYDDETGILIDYEIAILTAESEKTLYQITTEKALSTGKIRIMLWDKNLTPLTKAYEY